MKQAMMLLLLLTAAAGGCTSHFALVDPKVSWARSGLVEDEEQLSQLEKSMTDEDIAKLLEVDVRAKLPTSIAVAKLDDHCGYYQPRLARIDGAELQQWEQIAAKHEAIRGVQPISNLAFGDSLEEPKLTLHSLRVAAARMGCELLLVYMQGDSTVDNFNDAAPLYWSIVGLWLVPGNTLEHKTVIQAALVDCRTGMILGTATGDAHEKRLSAAMYTSIQEAKLAEAVPAAALADLQDGVRPLLSKVVARAAERTALQSP